MTEVFTLPDLGEGLEEAELVRWLVSVGDTVAVDAPVAEVETAKAMIEVPCPYAGVVAGLHGEAGDVIAVGAPLVSVEPAIERATARATARATTQATTQATAQATEQVTTQAPAPDAVRAEARGSGNVLIGYGTSDTPVTGGGRRALRRATAAAGTSRGAVAVASPVVRSLARTHGLDLRTLTGTGPGGLIVRADVERAVRAPTSGEQTAGTPAAARAPTPVAAQETPSTAGALPDRDPRTGLAVARRVPLRGVRRTVATRLSRSRQEIPEATTWVDVDATALLELRASLARPDRPAPGLLALLARFVVAGLAQYPELNAWVDVEGEAIVHLGGVNLGIAAQTDRGLVVPVVRDAHSLRTRDLDAEIRRLTGVAREGRATTEDLSGGSFTLNNYGVLGVDGSAAIINHPEVAILGIGRILPRPWVVDGEVAVRSIAQLSLVFDHRVCDGGTAGGFLRFVADAVESPGPALLDAAEL